MTGMRRAVLLILLSLALFPEGASASAPALGVRVAGCESSLQREQQAAEFTAAMPAVAGSSVLAMRFSLEQRRGLTWKSLSLPGAEDYERSAPGVAGFVFRKRVERLVGDASYRVTVQFRWYDAEGAVLRSATRRSGVCRPLDLRPDLTIVGLTAGEPVVPGRARYAVRVRNDGATAALGTLRIGLSVDGIVLDAQGIAGLAADATRTVSFEGPACPAGGNVRAQADPVGSVDEADEGDNVLSLRCTGA